MLTWLRGLVVFAAVALAGCGPFGSAAPSREFLSRRLDAGSYLVVGQVAAYYRDGRWRDLGDGSYAYDVKDRDPLTNLPRTINIIFAPVDATRTRPELAAVIRDFALNGQRLTPFEMRAVVAAIHREMSPPMPKYFAQEKVGTHAKVDQSLLCAVERDAVFGPFTVADLDRAYQTDRDWIRYERPGGVLADGAAFAYLVYAANDETQERSEYAVTTGGDGVTILARQDFGADGMRGAWRGDLRMCAETAALLAIGGAAAATEESATVSGVAPGMTYGDARTVLTAAGYTPFPLPYQSRDCGAMREACVANRELMECSGTGTNICLTVFARDGDGRLLIVRTQGEWSADFAAEVGVHSLVWADVETAARVRR